MIHVIPVPASDEAFGELLRFALNAAGATDRHRFVAQDVATLERALVTIRRECSGATIRRRDRLAELPGVDETWYVFRDG